MSIDSARVDIQRFLTTGGFQVNVSLTSPDGKVVSIKALAVKHFTTVDTDGNQINTKNARVTLVENNLITLNYPTRNAKGEVNLKSHKLDYADSTGILKHFVVKEWYPDETLGIITLILGDYEPQA